MKFDSYVNADERVHLYHSPVYWKRRKKQIENEEKRWTKQSLEKRVNKISYTNVA